MVSNAMHPWSFDMCDNVYVMMQSCRLWLFACKEVSCRTRFAVRKCLVYIFVWLTTEFRVSFVIC